MIFLHPANLSKSSNTDHAVYAICTYRHVVAVAEIYCFTESV